MKAISVLLFVFMGGGIWAGYWVEDYFARTRPTEPIAAAGRLFPHLSHGKTVYLTEDEIWISRLPWIIGLAAGVAGGAIWIRLPKKPA